MKPCFFSALFLLVFVTASFSAEKPALPGEKTPEIKENISKTSPASEPAKVETPAGMVFIKGACYEMGDNFDDGGSDEKPVHTACVDDFYMGKQEVTNREFADFVKETAYKTTAEKTGTGWGSSKRGANDWEFRKGINWMHPLWPTDDIKDKMDHPVVQVSWDDAQAYLEWLSLKTGKKYRLPTEAEWEYAARSGGKRYKYSWNAGEPNGNIADESAKRIFLNWSVWEGYNDGYVYTSPVGMFRPNELGLYDAMGNVWEWVQDWYADDYYKYAPKKNPAGPGSGEQRVLRGGSWISGPEDIHLSLRFSAEPEKREDIIGFRLALPAK